ncbi:MAG: alanine racemase [Anaerolineae bacterium]
MISLYDILEASNGQLFGEPAAQIFTGFCLDSRQAKNAQLYVALKTDRGDTHQYMQEAVENGVLGLLCTNPPEFPTEGISVILVKDTEAAMMAWANFVLRKFGTQVVGVAGTSGKTVTVDLVHRVLSVRYNVHKAEGSGVDGRLALPMTLARLHPEHRIVVIELSATQPGEMAQMVDTVHPDVGVLTHTGYAHTDYFGSPEKITEEMGVLLEHLQPNSLAVLNFDEEGVADLATRTKARVMTVGMEQFGADVMAYNVVVGPNGTGFDLRHKSERFVGRFSPLLGKQQLYHMLSALAVGMYYNVPLEDGLKALNNVKPLQGRMNPLVGVNDCVLIDDSYSANPQSTLAALDWLREATRDTKQRTIFVMSDMDHLGEMSKRSHRMVGLKAAEFVDLIITEGTDAAVVGRSALDQGIDPKRVTVTYSVEDTIAAVKRLNLTNNDVVLVKGGPSARMELVVKALLKNPQDSAQLVRQDFKWEEAVFQPARPSWLELDMDAMAGNVQAVKEMIGPDVALMAVVKADAYGHGAVQASSTALLNGADYLAVASMAEALELRDGGITAPILVLSYTPVYAVRQAIRHNIAIALYDLDMSRAYDRAARELGGKLRVHVKIDTGMGRLGVSSEDSMVFFRHVTTLRYLEIEGIYTHFAAADSDPDFTATQVREFRGVLKPLRASGFDFKYRHAANSAGTLASKENHFNMVRVGIALYGISPFEDKPLPPKFRPVMSWKTVVAQVRTLPPGATVGYGRTYHTSREERIAILPVGYADGVRRAPNPWGEVLIHGKRAPVVGRVSMEKIAVNVTDIEGVSIGDEVVMLGKQGDETITAEQIAKYWGTIPYEVVTSILARVPRK